LNLLNVGYVASKDKTDIFNATEIYTNKTKENTNSNIIHNNKTYKDNNYNRLNQLTNYKSNGVIVNFNEDFQNANISNDYIK